MSTSRAARPGAYPGPVLLALDTATSSVTVAVHDGDDVLAEHSEQDVRRHTELLAPTIRTVLRRAALTPRDLDAVVVGIGPGPFTGLRVGIATARTLGFALGIDVHGLVSLDALAQRVVADGGPQDFAVATDARRKEVYWARYRVVAGVPTRENEPRVDRPDALPADVRGLPCAGRGPLLYPDLLTAPYGPLDVDAGALASAAQRALGAGESLPPPEPLYLRRPDARPREPRVPSVP